MHVDHRSSRLSTRSLITLSKLAIGGGFGGGVDVRTKGSVITPDLTKSARRVSSRTAVREGPIGPNLATTRSRSVMSMVSPAAASWMYSLNLLLSALRPTDLI